MPNIVSTSAVHKENANLIPSKAMANHQSIFDKVTDITVPTTKALLTVSKRDVTRISPPSDNPSKRLPLPGNIVGFDYAFWAGKVFDVINRPTAFLPPDTWQKWVDSKGLKTFDIYQAPKLNQQHLVFCPVRVIVEWGLAIVVRPCMIGGPVDVYDGDEGTPHATRARLQAECSYAPPLVIVLCREALDQAVFMTSFRKFLENFVSADARGSAKTVEICFRMVRPA